MCCSPWGHKELDMTEPLNNCWIELKMVGSVYLWQIHFDIWQNQYNIVKLNKIKLKKNVRIRIQKAVGGHSFLCRGRK